MIFILWMHINLSLDIDLLLYRKILLAVIGTFFLLIILGPYSIFQIGVVDAKKIKISPAITIFKKQTPYRSVVHGVKNLQMVL